MRQEANTSFDRWSALMHGWGFPSNRATYDALVSEYSKPGRHYHTLKHVEACLKNLTLCADQADYPSEMELSLWFHDAIYKPLLSRNEEQSAEWAGSFLEQNSAHADQISRVRNLILVTRHEGEVQSKDESLLVDIDLAILGSDPGTFDDFEDQIRREYRMVPQFLYRKKRQQLLQGFLDRPRIYLNEPFYSRLEAQARSNLQSAISQLSGRA